MKSNNGWIAAIGAAMLGAAHASDPPEGALRERPRQPGRGSAMQRRGFLAGAIAMLAAPGFAKPAATLVEVWKGPACSCCGGWIKHLEANGFETRVFDSGNTDIRAAMGMPAKFGSCHTARVGGYAIEGHVPAREIRRLLNEKPRAVGLAAPGMPLGSPGMDGPEYGSRKLPYDVLLVARDGGSTVFQAYR